MLCSLIENCNIPNFQFGMLYIDHSCISYFIAYSFHDPRNSKQLRDPWRELGISLFSYLNFIKYRNEDQFVLLFFSLKIFHIKNYMKGDNMTFAKIMEYWRKNIKNKYLILFGFYLILFELGKICVFQNCILGPNKCSPCPVDF